MSLFVFREKSRERSKIHISWQFSSLAMPFSIVYDEEKQNTVGKPERVRRIRQFQSWYYERVSTSNSSLRSLHLLRPCGIFLSHNFHRWPWNCCYRPKTGLLSCECVYPHDLLSPCVVSFATAPVISNSHVC